MNNKILKTEKENKKERKKNKIIYLFLSSFVKVNERKTHKGKR